MIVGVLGAGAWGTALAIAAARAGCSVTLWGRDGAAMAEMETSRLNPRLPPDLPLAPAIRATGELAELAPADLVLATVPAQVLRDALLHARVAIGPSVPVVVCAKGIERGSGLLMSEVVRAVMPGNPPASLSGPSFAADVARGLPTAVTLAADALDLAAEIARTLASPALRLYHSDDLVGVEIGGAVKNVLAIACGIAQGRGLGASAVAALTARSFAELSRFGRALGARTDTLTGLSGLGDLVLTCGTAQSRNFSLGLAIGKGADPAIAGHGALTEGVATAPILLSRARDVGVDMPIVESVDAVLAGRLTVDDAIQALLSRPSKVETI